MSPFDEGLDCGDTGVIDLKRDRSLLPKAYQFFKTPHIDVQEIDVEDEEPPREDTTVLPLKLRLGIFQGESWCKPSFSQTEAPYANGSVMLNEELLTSHRRLVACR